MRNIYTFPNANNGKPLAIYHNSERFINEVLKDQGYKFIDYYPTVIDIGANIGTFSLYMYDKADEIYAIEPIEESFKLMEQTVRENKLKKIIVKQLAISDSTCTKRMKGGGSAVGGGWKISEHGDYEVNAQTLKDFMDDNDIEYADLVKIDVEGHELEIIHSPFFPKDRIGTIIGELHKAKENPDRVMVGELLERMGFNYYDLPNEMFLARKK